MGPDRMTHNRSDPEGRIFPRSRRVPLAPTALPGTDRPGVRANSQVLPNSQRTPTLPCVREDAPDQRGISNPSCRPTSPPSNAECSVQPSPNTQHLTPNTPATILSRLRGRFRQAVAAELCPDERLEFVAQPSRDKIGRLQGASLMGLTVQFSFLAAHLNSGEPLGSLGAGFWWLTTALLSMGWLWPGRNFTYVVTDQRCFRLSFRRGRLSVQDVSETPTEFALDQRDVDELERRIAVLSRGNAAGRSGERRPARELPRRLREAIQRQLAPNERLLWADQPNPRDYFMHAPLSPLAVLLILAMAVASLIALAATAPVLKLASGLTAANCALSAAAILWRQVRGTVYALTDQRGIVVSPGGRLTTYPAQLLRSFQRTQDAGGSGRLEHQGGLLDDGVGFYGLRNAKLVDDLIKNRATQEHGSEVTPIEAPDGRGDEVASES